MCGRVARRLSPPTFLLAHPAQPASRSEHAPTGITVARVSVVRFEPSNLVRIFADWTQPDHLKRFFALFGTRSLVPKSLVPALAHETRFLVQNFSKFKILTKFDGFRHCDFRSIQALIH